jgi:hypothetical protein
VTLDIPTRRQAGFATLVGLTTLAAMAITNARVLASDTFFSLYSGRVIANRGLPHVDTLTVAGQGRRWIDQQWLAHLIFFEVFRLGGYPLVGLLSAMLIAAAFAGFAWFLLELGTSPVRTTLWSIIAFFVCQPNTATRAQSFAYPLFVATLCVILLDERKPRWSWYVGSTVPLLVVWANLHGSVMLGAPLVVGYCLTRVLRSSRIKDWGTAGRYAATAVVAGIAPFVTPYGEAIYRYYLSVLSDPALKAASAEWHMTTLALSNIQFIMLTALLVIFGGMGLRRGYRPSPVLVAFTFVLMAAAIDSVRNQAWSAFPAVILVTGALSDTTAPAANEPPGESSVARAATATTLAVAMFAGFAFLALRGPSTERLQVLLLFVGVVLSVVVLTSRLNINGRGNALRRILIAANVAAALVGVAALLTTTNAQFNRLTPEAAVNHAASYLLKHPHTRVLADDMASGPMLWNTTRFDGRVGFDARFEIYPPRQLERYAAFIAGGPAWQTLLRGYSVVVVSTFQNPTLATRMGQLPDWRVLYRDTKGEVFVRSAG